MFDGGLLSVLEGVGRGELEAKGVAVAFGEEDTLFGAEDGPCHAMAKDSGSELAEVGGMERGLLLSESDYGICGHGVDSRAFGPQGKMFGSGHNQKVFDVDVGSQSLFERERKSSKGGNDEVLISLLER